MELNSLSSQLNKSSHVSNVLLQLAEDFTIENNINGINDIDDISSDLLIIDNVTNKVAVRITAKKLDGLLPILNNLGFEILGSAPNHHLIEGLVSLNSLSSLEDLAQEGLIMGVLPIYKPILDVGLTDSQADFVQEADRVRHALPAGYDGTGQTIAVFSDSYDISGNGSAAIDIASGDLPNDVNVLQEFTGTGIDEGRAMLQLVHDLAPGANLVFSSFFFGEANAAQQIRDAANPDIGDADVLVDDIGFLTAPFFQDGLVAQAVDEVVINNGVTYFSSAGNSADNSYESSNINFTPDSAGFFLNSFYDFNPTTEVDSRQEIILEPGQRFRATLQWDDPFYTDNGVDTDLLFGLIDSNNNVLAIADENNILNQTPYEFLDFINNTGTTKTYEVIITKEAGPDPNHLKYINFRNHNPTEYDTKSSTVFGHQAAINAQAVAAIPFFDQDNPEPFTSEGPTKVLFNVNGTPKAIPEIRNTPNIAAIDGTNTTFFANDISQDSDLFPNFFGTSAAAPHAAAIAALVQQANPNFTPQQVYNRLQSTAEDIGASGFDNVTGAGLINAYDAIFAPVVPAKLPFSANFDDGDLPQAFETNTNGAGRIQVTSDFSPLGDRQLTLDSSGILINSLNEVIIHLDTTGLTDVQLSFDQKEFSDEDQEMSEIFIGSENSDGVALSVDGITWYRLISLTGSNSTNSFQNNLFNLSAFAADNGLTLGSDLQIKFQQFDNLSLNLDGFAFDNISVTGIANSIPCNPTAGDDNLIPCATAGDDNLDGLAGNDLLVGGDGNDILNGGSGNDRILGQNDNDFITGGDDNDTLNGGTGNDRIFGQNDDDTLIGDTGNDTLNGGTGNDLLVGNNDDDTLIGDSGNDRLDGGNGNDLLVGNNDNDFIIGGNGNDNLDGGDGNDSLFGQNNDDFMIGGNGNDNLNGGAGNDRIFGQNDDDTLIGDTGNDTLNGGTGADLLVGAEDNDVLIGLDGDDSLNGGTGADLLVGAADNDFAIGGNGNDSLNGGDGNDSLFGQNDDDFAIGGNGNDSLNGGDGNDSLFGQNDDDTLNGGLGSDSLTGGTGSDLFILEPALPGEIDTILDFEVGIDRISSTEGLDFGSLTINQNGGDAIISNTATTETLAVLVGINATDLTAFDFI